MGAETSRQERQDAAHAAVSVLPLSPREALPSSDLLAPCTLVPRSGKDWTGGRNWTDIYFFPSLLTYGTAYESPEVGLSYESKIIAKLVLVAEL